MLRGGVKGRSHYPAQNTEPPPFTFDEEAHRSVYQKYGAIFRYFDSLLVGLTATPRDEVDRNTYELFELEPGVPTDAYELQTAVTDGFLVPPKAQQVDLKFPREGIIMNCTSSNGSGHNRSFSKRHFFTYDTGKSADSPALNF